jgi:hypothetical protein
MCGTTDAEAPMKKGASPSPPPPRLTPAPAHLSPGAAPGASLPRPAISAASVAPSSSMAAQTVTVTPCSLLPITLPPADTPAPRDCTESSDGPVDMDMSAFDASTSG